MGDTADDLERLVEELNSAERAVPPAGARLDRWLELVAQRSASDLLLLPGEPPLLRIDGRVVRTEGQVLDGSCAPRSRDERVDESHAGRDGRKGKGDSHLRQT